MPGLLLDISQMLSIHHPTIDHPSSSTTDEDDLACSALRFGDIPASSFSSGCGSRRGLIHSSPLGAPSRMKFHGCVSEVGNNNNSSSAKYVDIVSEVEEFGCSNYQGISVSVPIGAPAGAAATSTNVARGGGGSSMSPRSPQLPDAYATLQKFLPSSNDDDDDEVWPVDSWPALDVYSCDDFRMYEFKVRKCMRGRSHDWTECPFAHPGEKARRRDPRRFHYSGTACPDFRKGNCRRGEACEYAHGVFECWLHPARYRTQPCKDGRNCRRRVCFFAHTAEQLRVVSGAGAGGGGEEEEAGASVATAQSNVLKAAVLGGCCYDGSPLRRALAAGGTMALVPPTVEALYDDGGGGSGGGATISSPPPPRFCFSASSSSPTSTLVGYSTSPLLSPTASSPPSPSSPLQQQHAAHRRHLDRLQSLPTIAIPNFDFNPPPTISQLMSSLHHMQINDSAAHIVSSPWSPSQPSPSTPPSNSRHACQTDRWNPEWEPAAAPQTSSGRELRSKVYGKLGSETCVDNDAPDFGWVNELVK